MNAALDVTFTPIAPLLMVLSTLPSIIEGLVNAAMARELFGMDQFMSYTLGFMLAYEGSGVTLPSIFVLMVARGFIVRQEIPDVLAIGTTVDNLLVGCAFSIFKELYH
jgi:hypothetical protein